MGAPRVVTTLAIGHEYLRLALAMMDSVYDHLGDCVAYQVFYTRANPEFFVRPSFVDLTQIDEPHDLGGRFAPRRYKYVPLCHPSLEGKDVLYLDADVLTYDKGGLESVLDAISEHHVCVSGTFDDNRGWQRGDGSRFKLREAQRVYPEVSRNMVINSGLVGRNASSTGTSFSAHLQRLLRELTFYPFTGQYFNDEPYFAIAYQLATAEGGGYLLFDSSRYITTVGGQVEGPIDNPTIVKKAGRTTRPDIVHFVGYGRFDAYLHEVERRVPLSVSPATYAVHQLTSRLRQRLSPRALLRQPLVR